MISRSSILRKCIAWHNVRIRSPAIWYLWVPEFFFWHCHGLCRWVCGCLRMRFCTSWQNSANTLPRQMITTARSASKFCARDRFQSPNKIYLVLISLVIPGQLERWPLSYPFLLYPILFPVSYPFLLYPILFSSILSFSPLSYHLSLQMKDTSILTCLKQWILRSRQ